MSSQIETATVVLRNNELFSSLPPELLQGIAALAVRRSHPKGHLLFSQGDRGDSFYGVVSGRVRLSSNAPTGKQIHIVDFGPGSTFGEIALIDGGPRTADAVAASEVTLFAILRRDFLELLRKHPELTMQLLQRMCKRVRWTSELVEDISFLQPREQLAKRLVLLAESVGTSTGSGIELELSQADLASFLGLSRQLVNQHLQEWRRLEWLEVSRGRIMISDLDSLRAVVKDSAR